MVIPVLTIANSEIDSLTNILNSSSGIHKVNVLNRLSNLHLDSSIDKSLEYSQQALEISIRLNYLEGIANTQKYMGYAFYYKNEYKMSLRYFFESFEGFNKLQDDENVACCLSFIGMNHISMNNIDSAIYYYKKLLIVSRLIKNIEYEVFTLESIGTLNYKIRNFDETLLYHFEALKLYKLIGRRKDIASIYYTIGSDYCALCYYDKAIDNFLTSLSIFEEIEDSEGIFMSYHAIGTVYRDLNDYRKALYYNFKALNLRKKIYDNHLIARCLNSIGATYYYLEKLDSANVFSRESLTISKEINDKVSIVLSYDNIGNVYYKLSDYISALNYYLKGLEFAKIDKDKWLISKLLTSVGNAYIKMKKYNKAYRHLLDGLYYASNLKTTDLIQNSYKSLSDYYSAIGNYKMAYKYLQLFANLRNSIFTETSHRIADMQTRYETDKREKENEILKRNNSIQKLQLEKQILTKWRLYFGLGLISLILLFIYYRYRAKLRINKEQQKIIFHQASLTSLGELTAALAHEISQPLQSIYLSTRAVQSEMGENEPNKNIIDMNLKEISKNLHRIRYVIDHVKIFSSKQKDTINEEFYVNFAIKNAYSLVQKQLDKRGINIFLDLNDTIEPIFGNPFKLEQILLNLFSNARDAIEEKVVVDSKSLAKEIRIISNQTNDEVIISVEDNGIGIPQGKNKDVFQPFFSSKKLGQGCGLGLSISRRIVEEMNGTIEIDSNPGIGTNVFIRFPIKK
jgi:signal transduction histidine kinase